MSEDVYVRLREFMDSLPAGYPSTPTGVELKILRKLYSPEEAELTMQLTRQPEEAASVAARLGRSEAELAPRLEDLALKGLIFRTRDGDKRLYRAFQFVVGIYEFQIERMDREFCELFEEYMPYIGLAMASVKTAQMRVIPLESAIADIPAVADYDRIRNLVKEQELIAVGDCICRKEQELLGHKCDKPRDLCFSFGEFARFMLDNAAGRQIGQEETFRLLDVAENAGLILRPTNSAKIDAVCCCCTCCCGGLKTIKHLNHPANYVLSNYQAVIDPDSCTSCKLCAERCQMAAIEEGADTYGIIDGRCIGCGLCVASCPTSAIAMVEKAGVEAPPRDFHETIDRIRVERGVA
ncbi:MAG: 4Fe-4S binding protein [Deltaproteobacteria bacterium]|nr:4Fe-4S binding protein [Deltaproteobacteria bacterium]